MKPMNTYGVSHPCNSENLLNGLTASVTINATLPFHVGSRIKKLQYKFICGMAWAILISLCSTNAFAQDKTAEIDKIFSWIAPDAPGCVCAVAQNGKIVAN